MATKVCKHKNITILNNIIRIKIELTSGKKIKHSLLEAWNSGMREETTIEFSINQQITDLTRYMHTLK